VPAGAFWPDVAIESRIFSTEAGVRLEQLFQVK